MPTARTRPEPAGEPAPTTPDTSPTPVEDLPAPEQPAPGPDEDLLARAVGAEGSDRSARANLADALAEGTFAGPVFGGNPAHSFQPGSAMLGGSRAIPGRLDPMPESAYGPDAELLADPPLSAAEALVEVFRRVQPIAKGRQAEKAAGGYQFRGIDDVYAALHDLFAEVGLVVLPSTVAREREQRPRASGSGYNYVTHVHVRLRFLAQDGTSEELDGWGEGADTGDKSTGKAYSQAIKSALLAAFLIPTEASAADDPDRTNSEESRPFAADEVQRAERAYEAARVTTTVEDLAGVRHRALALLEVPVPMVDGGSVPLGYLIDAHRRRIESGS